MKKFIRLFYKKGTITEISIGIIVIFVVILSYFGIIASKNSRVAGSWLTDSGSTQRWTFGIFGRLRYSEWPCDQGCSYGEGTYRIKGDDIIFNEAIVHFNITTNGDKTCMTMTSGSQGVFVGTMCRLE